MNVSGNEGSRYASTLIVESSQKETCCNTFPPRDASCDAAHIPAPRSMSTFKRSRLKSSRTESQPENSSQIARQPDHGQDGVALAAEPSYDREYNDLLTLAEAVDR